MIYIIFWMYYKSFILVYVFTWQAATNYKVDCNPDLFVSRFWLHLGMRFPLEIWTSQVTQW